MHTIEQYISIRNFKLFIWILFLNLPVICLGSDSDCAEVFSNTYKETEKVPRTMNSNKILESPQFFNTEAEIKQLNEKLIKQQEETTEQLNKKLAELKEEMTRQLKKELAEIKANRGKIEYNDWKYPQLFNKQKDDEEKAKRQLKKEELAEIEADRRKIEHEEWESPKLFNKMEGTSLYYYKSDFFNSFNNKDGAGSEKTAEQRTAKRGTERKAEKFEKGENTKLERWSKNKTQQQRLLSLFYKLTGLKNKEQQRQEENQEILKMPPIEQWLENHLKPIKRNTEQWEEENQEAIKRIIEQWGEENQEAIKRIIEQRLKNNQEILEIQIEQWLKENQEAVKRNTEQWLEENQEAIKRNIEQWLKENQEAKEKAIEHALEIKKKKWIKLETFLEQENQRVSHKERQ